MKSGWGWVFWLVKKGKGWLLWSGRGLDIRVFGCEGFGYRSGPAVERARGEAASFNVVPTEISLIVFLCGSLAEDKISFFQSVCQICGATLQH